MKRLNRDTTVFQNGRRVACGTEASVFAAVGLPFIPPGAAGEPGRERGRPSGATCTPTPWPPMAATAYGKWPRRPGRSAGVPGHYRTLQARHRGPRSGRGAPGGAKGYSLAPPRTARTRSGRVLRASNTRPSPKKTNHASSRKGANSVTDQVLAAAVAPGKVSSMTGLNLP